MYSHVVYVVDLHSFDVGVCCALPATGLTFLIFVESALRLAHVSVHSYLAEPLVGDICHP